MLFRWFETKRCLHCGCECERLCLWCLNRHDIACLFSSLDASQLLTVVHELHFSQTFVNLLPDLLSRDTHGNRVIHQGCIDERHKVFSRDGLNIHAIHEHPAIEVIPNLNGPLTQGQDYWVRPFVYSSASHSQISPRVSMGTAVSGSSSTSLKRST